jgi:protein farnesyltransferase subunit beta
MSHLAPSYAAVLTLASVGGDALSIIDRRAMLNWLLQIKQPDGCFSVCIDGERDVRAIYCALTIISLLRLPVPKELLENTVEYLVRCQTYEGGFAATPGGNEAHGGYAFCALAALSILLPPKKLKEAVDMDAPPRGLAGAGRLLRRRSGWRCRCGVGRGLSDTSWLPHSTSMVG